MLTSAQIKKGLIVVHAGEPHLVVDSAHHKMGRGGAVMRTKLKNLKTGSAVDVTYQGNEKAEEAQLQRTQAQFLYRDDLGAHFMDSAFEQFCVGLRLAGESLPFLKEGQEVDISFWEGSPVSIKLPPKVDLKVTEAAPAVKGDTANSPSKTITLETGFTVQSPLFVKQGDVVRVNTETGEYVERA